GDGPAPPGPVSSTYVHGKGWIGSIAWVANLGGQTTARRPTPTHSQTTLVARTFSPASGVPGGPNRTPLPLGSPPCGISVASADRATPAGESEVAPGRTSWSNAHAAENPARAGALISPP